MIYTPGLHLGISPPDSLLLALAKFEAALRSTRTTMSDPQSEATNDSLGLDLGSLKIDDSNEDAPATATKAEEDAPPDASAQPEAPQTPTAEGGVEDDKRQPQRERKKPYVNPERVKTGGPQRVCSAPG